MERIWDTLLKIDGVGFLFSTEDKNLAIIYTITQISSAT